MLSNRVEHVATKGRKSLQCHAITWRGGKSSRQNKWAPYDSFTVKHAAFFLQTDVIVLQWNTQHSSYRCNSFTVKHSAFFLQTDVTVNSSSEHPVTIKWCAHAHTHKIFLETESEQYER